MEQLVDNAVKEPRKMGVLAAELIKPRADEHKAVKIEARGCSVFYGKKQVLFDVNLKLTDRTVTSLIGPSGCGKTTLLRCFNRLNDVIPTCRVEGEIMVDDRSVYDPRLDPVQLRARIGIVFQKPNPFPKSVYENVAYGPRIHGLARSRDEMDHIVEKSLRQASLWNEVSDRLHDSGISLSGGQQQRLCIARAVATSPEVLLMDEPCSALDPIATARIEDLINELSDRYAIVIVTHSMQQAARVSNRTAFFHLGYLVEEGETQQIFTNPQNKLTQDYITGRIG